MPKRWLAAVIALLLLAGAAPTEQTRLDIARIRALIADRGEALWKGLSSAPFAMLLIESERETLWCDTRLPIGFVAGPRDAVTGCATATRARSNLDAGLLAAFPLFGAPLTIVMGTPQATDRTRAQWLRTILHEHFHQ